MSNHKPITLPEKHPSGSMLDHLNHTIMNFINALPLLTQTIGYVSGQHDCRLLAPNYSCIGNCNRLSPFSTLANITRWLHLSMESPKR
jgi:hypothetical protein